MVGRKEGRYLHVNPFLLGKGFELVHENPFSHIDRSVKVAFEVFEAGTG